MTFEQGLLFALFATILGMLVWGRFRYDLVAAGGLFAAVVLGLVPQDEAFSGFANDAVVIVALVLIASRAFENTGVLALLGRVVASKQRSVTSHIAITGGIGAALSAVINNVAALALLMPLDVEAARKAGRPPGLTLMPLAYATIIGGMVTLIGTPTNIIASSVRAEYLGAPYRMFDFTPVGLTIAVAGIFFVALIGWRLVPRREDRTQKLSELSFLAELRVTEDSKIAGKLAHELDDEIENADVILVGLIRDGRRYYRRARAMTVQPDDVLIVEGSTDAIGSYIKAVNLQEAEREEADKDGQKQKTKKNGSESADKSQQTAASTQEIVEAVVRADSRLIGGSAKGLGLRRRYGLTLLGISHSGILERTQVRDRTIEAGDVLLLTGPRAVAAATLDALGAIPINRVRIAPVQVRDAVLVVGLFVGAIVLASAGILSFTVAIGIAVAGYAASGIVPARDFYTHIEWPVVVMLACLLPIGSAFGTLGGTALIAESIAQLSMGTSPIIALIVLMIVTMTLSDALNNVATIIIMGPVAIDLALRLNVNPDTFLMGAAVASACAFLTPIGHKNNTLIMGPGGFRFSDYWQMGLPLEILVLAVGVPMLLIVWPL